MQVQEQEREKDRAEDGGEGGGADHGAGLKPESGFVGEVASEPEKNLTSEANGGLAASEADKLAEVAALSADLDKWASELSALSGKGNGACGTPVAGGEKGRALIEAWINGGGPLLRPIS